MIMIKFLYFEKILYICSKFQNVILMDNNLTFNWLSVSSVEHNRHYIQLKSKENLSFEEKCELVKLTSISKEMSYEERLAMLKLRYL